MTLNVGDSAPIFELKNTELKDVSLADAKGQNVLLLFFPFAFTGVCTEELCQTRDELTFYNGVNAVVYGISVDSPFTLAKFKAENNLNFDLLSDFNKEVSTAYGALYEEFVAGLKGVSKRSAFVIDEEGKVKYAEVLDNAGDMPNFEAIQVALKNLN